MSFIFRKKITYYKFCDRFLFFSSLKLFSDSFNFLTCLAVAKKVLGRTHALDGTTVEVCHHSVTDEFQTEDGSGNQVRPTAKLFKLPIVFHLASSFTESKSFFNSLIA